MAVGPVSRSSMSISRLRAAKRTRVFLYTLYSPPDSRSWRRSRVIWATLRPRYSVRMAASAAVEPLLDLGHDRDLLGSGVLHLHLLRCRSSRRARTPGVGVPRTARGPRMRTPRAPRERDVGRRSPPAPAGRWWRPFGGYTRTGGLRRASCCRCRCSAAVRTGRRVRSGLYGGHLRRVDLDAGPVGGGEHHLAHVATLGGGRLGPVELVHHGLEVGRQLRRARS